MEKSKINLSSWLVIGVLGVLGIGTAVFALSGANITFQGNCVDCFAGSDSSGVSGDESFGGGTRHPNGLSADSTSPSAGEVRGTTLTATGATTLTGVVSAGTSIGINATNTATTVLDMLGTMRTYTAGVATTTCDTGSAGAMMYSTGTAKLMGCDGATWQALW